MATSTNAASDADALVRFARRVSHDLNNFSTVVRTYSEMLLSDLPEADPMHADVAEIYRAADATVLYVQRVTQFARAGSMRRVPTAVDDGIADAHALFAAEQGGRTVQLSLGGGIVHADANWLRDTVIELLRNAHVAAPTGTAIIVRSTVHDATVTIDIEDEGEGIPPELLSTITEPFVTSRQGVRGAGMGLAIVAAFVRTLEGSLQFDRGIDPSPTRTRVRLVLPADAATDA